MHDDMTLKSNLFSSSFFCSRGSRGHVTVGVIYLSPGFAGVEGHIGPENR